MPPGVSTDDASAIMQTQSLLMNTVMGAPDVLRYGVGAFLQDWLAGMREPQRLRLYSAHDSTLRVFLQALHSFDSRWPPYASHALLEQWSEDATGKQFVLLQYDGVNRVMLPPCKNVLCPVEDFVTLLQSYNPGSACAPQTSI